MFTKSGLVIMPKFTLGKNRETAARAAGLIVKNGRVLLHRSDFDDFWALPGGAINKFESAEEAIKREYLEELNVNIKAERLLWIVENFFEYDKVKFHEIGLYFLVNAIDSEEKLAQDEFYGTENDFQPEKYGEFKLIFRWFLPSELDAITIKPKFLKKALKNIPKNTEHILTNELEKRDVE